MPVSMLRPVLLAVSLTLAAGGAGDAQAAPQKKRAAAKPRQPAIMQPTACSDFYQYGNRTWLDANLIVSGSGMNSTMGELQQRAVHQQVELLNAGMASQAGIAKALGDFWASGLDEVAVERDGAAPIAPLLARIDAIKRTRDIAPAVAALHQVGIPVLFNFSADIDLNDLNRHMGYFSQGGLGLPDPAWYTRGDADTRALFARYQAYVKQILTLTGTPPEQLDAATALVIDLENRIAPLSKPIKALKDPRANYAPVEAAALAKPYRNLQLTQFLEVQGVPPQTVSMADPQLFSQLDLLVKTLKPEQWKAYLRFHVGSAMAPYLSRAWRNADFDFRGRVLRGETAPKPRQQQVLDAINLAAGPMLGREYMARYLGPSARQRATEVAQNVRQALLQAIDGNTWMSPAAKAEAKSKLETLRIEIGAPRYDLDYTLQPMGRGSFGGNMLIASTWRHREEMRRIGAANADRRWNVLPQQPALAYDLAHNRLIVTAAVLQPPVLDVNNNLPHHYGSFGALVGHELSHAFDNKGRSIDAAGNARDWWSPAETAAWSERANQLATQFSTLPYPGVAGRTVNGALTRDENFADLAGLRLAWNAYKTAQPGPAGTGDQNFFNGWNQLWAQQMSPDVADLQAITSLYAPGQWRSNAPLRNMPEFAASFGCKPADAMTLPAGIAAVNPWN